jgi:hypothetical protein
MLCQTLKWPPRYPCPPRLKVAGATLPNDSIFVFSQTALQFSANWTRVAPIGRLSTPSGRNERSILAGQKPKPLTRATGLMFGEIAASFSCRATFTRMKSPIEQATDPNARVVFAD